MIGNSRVYIGDINNKAMEVVTMAHELNIGTIGGENLKDMLSGSNMISDPFGVIYTYPDALEFSTPKSTASYIGNTYNFALRGNSICYGTNGIVKRYRIKTKLGIGGGTSGSFGEIIVTWSITIFGSTFNFSTGVTNGRDDYIEAIDIIRNSPAGYASNGQVKLTDCTLKITNCTNSKGSSQSNINTAIWSQQVNLQLMFDAY